MPRKLTQSSVELSEQVYKWSFLCMPIELMKMKDVINDNKKLKKGSYFIDNAMILLFVGEHRKKKALTQMNEQKRSKSL